MMTTHVMHSSPGGVAAEQIYLALALLRSVGR